MRDVFFLALSQSLTSFPQISQTFPVAASTKIAILIKIKKKNENFLPYKAKNGVPRSLLYRYMYMYIYTADGHHISHVERDRVTEGLLRYIVYLFVGVTRFVMLLYVCGGIFW